MSRLVDLKGKKYNRWTVLELSNVKNKKAYWKCQCECGTVKEVVTANLKNGHSKSCGCLNKINRQRKINGLSNTRLYKIYNGIKTRCYNKQSKPYVYYGNRGIKMYPKWHNDFLSFYNWSMNNGYNEKMTIDRIDVMGNYEPSNCRWVPMLEQYHNRTDNVYYEINGCKKCLAEWCKEYNMPYQTVRKRLERGKDIVYSLQTPIKEKYRNNLHNKKGE